MAPLLEGQLSPGDLSNAHRSLDGPLSCTQCHTFGAGQPVFKCLDCHTEIADRVAADQGYHASVVEVSEQGRDCAACHRDHVGREFQLVHWPNGQQRFDHGEAGYDLEGAHARQQCRDCHSGAHEGQFAEGPHGPRIQSVDLHAPHRFNVPDAIKTCMLDSLMARKTRTYQCSVCHTSAACCGRLARQSMAPEGATDCRVYCCPSVRFRVVPIGPVVHNKRRKGI
jgi:hypothetical protein